MNRTTRAAAILAATALTAGGLAVAAPGGQASAANTTTRQWHIPGSESWGPSGKPGAYDFARIFPKSDTYKHGRQVVYTGQCGWSQRDTYLYGTAEQKKAVDALDDDGVLLHYANDTTEDSKLLAGDATFVYTPCTVTVKLQGDKYRPASTKQAKRTAALDNDGRLSKGEDYGIRRDWRTVTVTVPKGYTSAQLIKAYNAKVSGSWDVSTTGHLGSIHKGQTVATVWLATAGYPQKYVGRSTVR